MATLLQEDKIQRASGTGLEGPGPAVDLPSMGTEQPAQEELRITVRPSKSPNVNEEAVNAAPVAGTTETDPPPAAAGNNNWSKIQEALSQGYSREEIAGYLQKNLGVSPDEADKQVIESVQQKIKDAQASGYNDAEIKDYLIQNRYNGAIIDSAMKSAAVPKPWKKYEWDPNTPVEDAKDIADLYRNVHGKYSTTGKQIGGFFNEQMGIEARREINQLNVSIAAKLKADGIDAFINPTTGDLMMKDKNGMEQEVDSSFVNDFYNGKTEIAGAIAGGIVGAKVGVKAPLRLRPYTIPLGAIGGSMVGAGAGKAADMVVNSMYLKEDLEAKLYLTQMKEAAIFDGVAGVIGAGIFKMGAAGARQVMKAYDFALAGNSKGAYKALLENMQITDDQAKEIVAQWEQFNEKKAVGRNFEEKAISVIATTQQGTEGFVKHVAATNPKLATSIISDVDARAKGLTKAIDTVADENVGALIKNDLALYQKDVKDFYGQVKQMGADAIDGTDFRFNLDKLAIQPVLENISKKISNPVMRERFVAHASRIESASGDRTFSGLIELRQAVNDFKYSKTGLTAPDMEALNGVINRIDGTINKAVREYMPTTGKEWLSQFSKAKTEYAKMKQLETNVLFKAINRKGVTEEQIQKFAKKYIDSLDGTFDEVMTKLPPATRAKAEGAVIKQLTDKYTLGEAVDKQAIHFPALSDALKNVSITTPEAKRLVQSIDEMAKIFKNDVNLSKVSGNIAVPKFQSFLTTDPVMRAKYEVASQVFNTVKRFVPGKAGNNIALLNRLNKLLENPIHVKTAEDLVRNMPKESQAEMQSLVKQLQIEFAKQPKRPQADWLRMYKQTTSGKMTKSDGALGKGVYLVDKVKNPKPESKVISHEVNMSKMATLKDISALVGREVTEKEIRTIPNLQEQLIQRGFLGIRTEGKAMLFPETTRGVKSTTKPIINETTRGVKSTTKPIINETTRGVKSTTKPIINETTRGVKSTTKPIINETKSSLDKALEKRATSGGLTSGQGTATKEFSKINQLVKKLKNNEIPLAEAQAEADKLGYKLIKRAKSGSSKNTYASSDYSWSYVKKKIIN